MTLQPLSSCMPPPLFIVLQFHWYKYRGKTHIGKFFLDLLMKRIFLAALFFPALALHSQPLPADTIINGVKICSRYAVTHFPETWRAAPIDAMGEPISHAEQIRSLAAVIRAMKKYPRAVLQKNLKAVYFLRAMKFYHVDYGGTNSFDALFLTNEGAALGYSDLYLEQTFHHEFSSILYRNFPQYIDSAAWAGDHASDADYTDPENGVGAIRNNRSSQDFDTALCARGFLTQYATSGMENDINTIAQNLFSPSPGFWTIVDYYPRIALKTRLLIDFYHKLDPSFTESFFRKIANP